MPELIYSKHTQKEESYIALSKLTAVTTLDNAWSSRRDLGPEVSALLGHWTSDGRTLHFSFGVNNNSSVVLEVDESTLSSSPRLPLSDNDCLKNLLSELGLTLLDRNHHHITDGGTGKTVKSGTNALDGNNVQVLTAGVVSTVDEGSNSQTESYS